VKEDLAQDPPNIVATRCPVARPGLSIIPGTRRKNSTSQEQYQKNPPVSATCPGSVGGSPTAGTPPFTSSICVSSCGNAEAAIPPSPSGVKIEGLWSAFEGPGLGSEGLESEGLGSNGLASGCCNASAPLWPFASWLPSVWRG